MPSMVKGSPDVEEFLQSLTTERDSETLSLLFADGYVPDSVFSHLVLRCLSLCPLRPRVFNRCARLEIDSDHDLVLIARKVSLVGFL